MLIDTHCHLDFPEFDSDRDAVVERAREAGLVNIINVGSSLLNSQRATALAERYEMVYATVGCHPHEADAVGGGTLAQLEKLAGHAKVAAIGETGLDYFKGYSSPGNQEKLFLAQVRLAKDAGLPLVIHCRQAQADVVKILRDNMPLKAVVHCFSGDENFLNDCLDLGFFISFTCNITYKKAGDLRALAAAVPLDRLMLETDAPYLSPEGNRGKRNEPMQVKHLAGEIAVLRKMSVEEIGRITTHNAKTFFGLDNAV
jgi:TatD DNase family protein